MRVQQKPDARGVVSVMRFDTVADRSAAIRSYAFHPDALTRGGRCGWIDATLGLQRFDSKRLRLPSAPRCAQTFDLSDGAAVGF